MKKLALGLPIQVHRQQLFKGGECNQVFFVTATDGKRYVLKQRKVNGLRNSELNNLVTEGELLRYLNQCNSALPIPRIYQVSKRPASYTYPFLKGESLGKAWEKLSERSRIRICYELAQFHDSLYRYSYIKTLKRIGLKVLAEEKPIREITVTRYLKQNRFPVPVHCTILTLLHQQIGTSQKKVHRMLCHNDCHRNNILTYQNRLSAVIDFGDACIADVHTDFVYYAIDFPDYFERIVQQFENLTGIQVSVDRIVALSIIELTDRFRQPVTRAKRKLIQQLLKRLSS